ncbi:unnamed protein product [Enterobius vermicularis]|uniref:RxLR effector candidate protein n=1 Tax=Enterobius vermicularis TaxID=51028 RepID=A0A0N4V848_ENTVE|nr:unnamed protein product [Enterobius vermicularis]
MAYILLIFVTILGLTLCSPAKHMKIISSTPPARFIKEFELGSQRTEVLSRSQAIASAYQSTRQKVQEWIRETRDTSYSLSALIGALSAVSVILLFYAFRRLVRTCHSRNRIFRFAKKGTRLGDSQKLIECKTGDSDNDLI